MKKTRKRHDRCNVSHNLGKHLFRTIPGCNCQPTPSRQTRRGLDPRQDTLQITDLTAKVAKTRAISTSSIISRFVDFVYLVWPGSGDKRTRSAMPDEELRPAREAALSPALLHTFESGFRVASGDLLTEHCVHSEIHNTHKSSPCLTTASARRFSSLSSAHKASQTVRSTRRDLTRQLPWSVQDILVEHLLVRGAATLLLRIPLTPSGTVQRHVLQAHTVDVDTTKQRQTIMRHNRSCSPVHDEETLPKPLSFAQTCKSHERCRGLYSVGSQRSCEPVVGHQTRK